MSKTEIQNERFLKAERRLRQEDLRIHFKVISSNLDDEQEAKNKHETAQGHDGEAKILFLGGGRPTNLSRKNISQTTSQNNKQAKIFI